MSFLGTIFGRLFRRKSAPVPPPLAPTRPIDKPPIAMPPKVEPRQKIYMTSFGGSPDEVCQYVNLRFLPCWGTTDFAQIADEIQRTVALGVTEVSLYVDWLMWSNTNPVRYLGSGIAMTNLHNLCAFLESKGVLRHVKFWWMPDEPARDKKISESDFRRCALDMQSVSAQFPELNGVQYAVIYGDENDKRLAIDLMHFIGLDNYGRGADILRAYDDIERGLQPHQSTMIVPGMYTVEGKPMVIEAFLEYVKTHPRCRMMCVFLYDVAQGGYGFNGTAPRVLAVANEVKRMNDPAYVPPAPSQEPQIEQPTEPPVIPWPQAGS